MSKIFGIGLSRTGTTSLTQALRILGYSAVHLPISIQQILDHDAATDTSIAMGFEFLDLMFPGSKFIYTIRDFDAWSESMRKFFSTHPMTADGQKIRRALYGGGGFHRDAAELKKIQENFKGRVERYFESRSLLALNICVPGSDEEKWDRLCYFLGRSVPDVPFPHLNAS